MHFTNVHTNALAALLFQTILTGGLIVAVVLLVTETVDVNGAKDILLGSLLTVIGMSIREMSEAARRFASMKEDS